MRGNHRIWGRQDYKEPPPLPPEALARITACTVAPRWPDRSDKWNWHSVCIGDSLVGYVKTGLGGQSYRTPEMDDWFFAAREWNHADPLHGHAILRLLEAVDEQMEMAA